MENQIKGDPRNKGNPRNSLYKPLFVTSHMTHHNWPWERQGGSLPSWHLKLSKNFRVQAKPRILKLCVNTSNIQLCQLKMRTLVSGCEDKALKCISIRRSEKRKKNESKKVEKQIKVLQELAMLRVNNHAIGGFRHKTRVDSGGFRWMQVDSEIFDAEKHSCCLGFCTYGRWIQRNHLTSL